MPMQHSVALAMDIVRAGLESLAKMRECRCALLPTHAQYASKYSNSGQRGHSVASSHHPAPDAIGTTMDLVRWFLFFHRTHLN